MTMEYTLNFEGPYTFFRDRDLPCIFDGDEATSQHGIYAWAIRMGNGEDLVSYIGETGVSFKERFTQHLSAQLGGLYPVYRPEQLLAKNIDLKAAAWPGLYGRDRAKDLTGFLGRLEEISSVNRRSLELVHLYIAPGDWERDVRLSIERAVANWIRSSEQAFYEDGIRYAGRELPAGDVLRISSKGTIKWPDDVNTVKVSGRA